MHLVSQPGQDLQQLRVAATAEMIMGVKGPRGQARGIKPEDYTPAMKREKAVGRLVSRSQCPKCNGDKYFDNRYCIDCGYEGD